MSKEAKYNFDKNLIKASLSDSLEEAKKEWLEICKETKKNIDSQCICQREIKHLKYFYNINTRYTIIVGSSCCNKFKFHGRKIENKIFRSVLKDQYKGQYKVIDDMIEYTNSVKKQLIEYFESYTNERNIYPIEKAIEEIKMLIDNYNLDYLNDTYSKLIKLLEEKERRERERREREHLEKECREKEHREREHLEKECRERERRERERRERERRERERREREHRERERRETNMFPPSHYEERFNKETSQTYLYNTLSYESFYRNHPEFARILKVIKHETNIHN